MPLLLNCESPLEIMRQDLKPTCIWDNRQHSLKSSQQNARLSDVDKNSIDGPIDAPISSLVPPRHVTCSARAIGDKCKHCPTLPNLQPLRQLHWKWRQRWQFTGRHHSEQSLHCGHPAPALPCERRPPEWHNSARDIHHLAINCARSPKRFVATAEVAKADFDSPMEAAATAAKGTATEHALVFGSVAASEAAGKVATDKIDFAKAVVNVTAEGVAEIAPKLRVEDAAIAVAAAVALQRSASEEVGDAALRLREWRQRHHPHMLEVCNGWLGSAIDGSFRCAHDVGAQWVHCKLLHSGCWQCGKWTRRRLEVRLPICAKALMGGALPAYVVKPCQFMEAA